MKRFRLIFAASLLLTLFVVSCNILKNEDNSTELRKFVASFEKTLTLSDDEILKQFESTQSKESILSAIRILQNKESKYIQCTADFSDFTILGMDDQVKIQVHAVFKSTGVDQDYDAESGFVLELKRKNNSYVITALKGEEFYAAFAAMRGNMEWSVEREEALKARQPFFTKAEELQKKYDSVVCFARYKDVSYFYVVNGEWNWNRYAKKQDCVVGLVDEQNNSIIPVEFDFIGTIGFAAENIVEVGKNGKVGYFDLTKRRLLIEPQYDMIVPYNLGGAYAIVKTDSTYGWFDDTFQFTAGFPSTDAEKFIMSYGFLPQQLKITMEFQGIAEIPDREEIGRGWIMPPSYFVATGVFPPVIDGISTTKVPMHGWTEYVETKHAQVESITDNLNALITTVTQRYLEGREEFYTDKRLVFVNDDHDTLSVSRIFTDKEMEIVRLDNGLIEVKSYPQYWMETSPEDNANIPSYAYFEIEQKGVRTRTSKRSFSPSQFVKLDSTYLQGDFYWYDSKAEEEKRTTFLSISTITYFRNEMLAEYGYRFEDQEDIAKHYHGDMQPKYNTIDEFRDQMTEVDRYNLDFFDRIIGRMQGASL